MKYGYCISTVQIPLDSSLSQNHGMIFLRHSTNVSSSKARLSINYLITLFIIFKDSKSGGHP